MGSAGDRGRAPPQVSAKTWLLLQLPPLLPEKLFGTGLCSPSPRGVSSQWAPAAGTAGTDGASVGPSASPTRLSGKWLSRGGPPRASSWRKRKAGAGIGSPEGGAKPPQGCGWEVRVEACCQAGDGASHLALPGRLRPLPCPLLSLLEHLWGLCPGAEGPPSGPPAERREGRPGHPRRARL